MSQHTEVAKNNGPLERSNMIRKNPWTVPIQDLRLNDSVGIRVIVGLERSPGDGYAPRLQQSEVSEELG